MSSKVYFTDDITGDAVVKMYNALGVTLGGRVACKLHTGEDGNQNYLRPEFFRPVIELVNGTVVETNTAYGGARNSTEKHLELIKKHGWDTFDFDILDSVKPDMPLDIPDGKVLKQNLVGKHLENYDSMLVLAHFKGHPAGGYGGVLKQLSIGCASAIGKCLIHSGGKVDDLDTVWSNMAPQDTFCEAMADAAASVVNMFAGRLAFVNVMVNLSVDCDCCDVAEDPCMKDIGILSSTDPVALDRACLDLVYASDDPGKMHLIERVEKLHGAHTIEAAQALGVGTTQYELIKI